MRIEVYGCEFIVRFETADIARLTLTEGHDKRGELLSELI